MRLGRPVKKSDTKLVKIRWIRSHAGPLVWPGRYILLTRAADRREFLLIATAD
mgnify:CR=1 FL=1